LPPEVLPVPALAPPPDSRYTLQSVTRARPHSALDFSSFGSPLWCRSRQTVVLETM
jgi:hypothetical protein